MRQKTSPHKVWLPVFISAMVVLAIGLGSIALSLVRHQLMDRAGETLALAATEMANKLDLFLFERHQDIQTMVRTPVFQQEGVSAKQAYLTAIQNNAPKFTYMWLAVTNRQGVIVASTNRDSIGRDMGPASWFEAVQQTRDIVVEDVSPAEEAGGMDAVALSAPILDGEGAFLGALTARVALIRAEEIVTQPLRTFMKRRGFTSHLEYQVLTEEGLAFIDSDLRHKGLVNLKRMGLPSVEHSASGEPGFIAEQHLRRQVPVITGYARTSGFQEFDGFDWTVLIRVDQADVLAPILSVVWKTAAAGVVILLPLLGGLIWSHFRIQREWKDAETQREWLATTLHSIGDAVIATDQQGAVTIMNPVAESLTGWTQAEAAGTQLDRVFSIINEETRQPVENPVSKVARTGQIVGLANHTLLVARDGTTRPIDDSGAPIRNEAGWMIGVILVFRDVTERRRIEEANARMAAILEATTDFVGMFDRTGRALYINRGGRRLIQIGELDEVTSASIADFHPSWARTIVEHTGLPLADQIGSWTGETALLSRDGQEIPVSQVLLAHCLADGSVAYYSTIARDIRAQKAAEEELRHAKEAAEAANRAKSEFLATMSHEIRTPMNAIIGMADLLWDTELTEEQREYAHIFRNASATLLNLLTDILDLSKIEAGHLELAETDFDLAEAVERALEMMGYRAHEQGLELAGSIEPDVPVQVQGDPHRFRQVLLNLLSNAIKFTKHGEVVIHVQVEPTGHSPYHIRCSVKDTGVGIPEEKIRDIFRPFVQVDSSTTRTYGGTGLGLTISKRLVEIMGGSIRMESTVGEGTTVSVSIPFKAPVSPEEAPEMSPDKLWGLKTLVVDDNATNRLILHQYLSGMGADVTEVADGPTALDEIRRAVETGTPYQLVLLDNRMPDMSGFEVAEAIRHANLPSSTLLMLTSDEGFGEIARAREVGLAGYLVKPVQRGKLLAAITDAMRQDSARDSSVTAQRETSRDQEPLTILLAEDSPDNQALIRSYLRTTSINLEIAATGEEAVERYRTHAYDLILMDVQMPVMDGYAAARAIREYERNHGRPAIPIIALTAHALDEDLRKAQDAGCTAHLTKPVKKDVLLEAIRRYTRGTASPDPPSPDDTPETAEQSCIVHVDPDLQDLIPGFLENRRQDVARLDEAISREDYETVRGIGHRLKGDGRGYGFDEISVIGERLETAAEAHDVRHMAAEKDRLARYLERVTIVYADE